MIKHLLLVSLSLALLCSYSPAQQTSDTLIILERDPGFWGRAGQPPADCPFYKLTIFANGNVELEPKNVKEYKVLTGKTLKSRISKKQLKQLVSEFEKIDFYSLNSISEKGGGADRGDCPQYGTDGATSITTINFKGKTKRLEHYHGCSGTEVLLKLTNLENKIDEVVNTKQWFDCYGGRNRLNLPTQTN